MKTLMGVAISETDAPWDGWADSVIDATGPIRWRLLVTGERTPTKGLTMCIGYRYDE